MLKNHKARFLFFMCGVIILLLPPGVALSEMDNATLFKQTELMFLGEDLYTVSIASRKAEPLERAPAAVTVISRKEIKKYRTLSEALRRVPGFFIDRNELKERIYLRGIPDSFLVMMDGVPFSSDASAIDYPRGMELSLDYIEKIEIIRGPGSSLWGPDAFSGIINLLTKKGADLQGASIKAETGSYDTLGLHAQAGFSKKGWDLFLFGSVSQAEGYEHDVAGSTKRRDDRFGEIYVKASYKDIVELSGRYSQYRDYFSIPNFLTENSEHKAFSFVQATVNKSFEDASVSLQGWYQYFDSMEDYDRTGSQYWIEQHNRQYGMEFKYDQALFGNNFATFGASFRYNDGSTTRQQYRDSSFYLFPNYYTHLFSFYFQDKWKIMENLEATVGLRYDNHSEYSHFYSPRVGVNYMFWNYFNLKLLYGRAFRTPSLAVIIEETGLDPEQIDSYEVEIGFSYKNIFSIQCNYFYNELDDIIERNALGNIANKSDDNIKGVEVSLTLQPHRAVTLYAGYSHLFGNRQRGTSATREIPSEEDPSRTVETTLESFYNVAPDNVISCGLDYRFLNYFRLNLEMNYVDRRKILETVGDGSASRTSLSSYVLFDVNLFVTNFPVKNVEMAFKIKNITDKQYYSRGVFDIVDGEGSSMYFFIKYTF